MNSKIFDIDFNFDDFVNIVIERFRISGVNLSDSEAYEIAEHLVVLCKDTNQNEVDLLDTIISIKNKGVVPKIIIDKIVEETKSTNTKNWKLRITQYRNKI